MSEPRSTPPATALVTRRVRRGRAAEFESLMAGMQAVAAQFPGHMGGFLIPPAQAEHGCYRMLFAFDSDAHLQNWMRSQERQQWHRRIAEVTHAGTATRVHPLGVVMVSTALITVAMTWVVIPNLVPRFANWLYPALAETGTPTQPPSEDS